MTDFKAAEVKERVVKLFEETKDIEACRQQFLQEIMDWSDYFSENCISENHILQTDESLQLLNEITELWIAYAQFESSLKQFKNAVEIYEKALLDPYVNKTTKIYQSFAEYSMSRNKPGNAQKVVIRGLCAELARKDSDYLWKYLLELTNGIAKVPSTYQELQKAVTPHLPANVKLAPLPDFSLPPITPVTPVIPPHFIVDNAESKETEPPNHRDTEQAFKTEVLPAPPSVIFPVANELTHASLSQQDDFDSLSGMTPEQVVHLFRSRPFMLFVAPNQEPMASGLKNLNQKEMQIIENFFGLPLRALTILDSKAVPSNERKKAEYYLDVLEELYYMQALKERHFDAWISELRAVHSAEEKVVTNKLKSLASGIVPAQHPDMQKFRKHCTVQIELLTAIINKIMFAILLEQQKILAELSFPFFTDNFINQLNDSLHQKKILLQNRGGSGLKGSDPSANATSKTFFNSVINQDLLYQQKIVCSLLSIRFNLIEQNRYNKLRTLQRTPVGSSSAYPAPNQSFQQQNLAAIHANQPYNIPPARADNQGPFNGNSLAGGSATSNWQQANNNSMKIENQQQSNRIPSDDYYDNQVGGDGNNRGRRRKKRRRPKNLQTTHNYGNEKHNYYTGNDSFQQQDYEEGSETPNSRSGPGASGEEGYEDDFVQSEEYPLLTRQYSNSYSDASISSYTQNIYHNDMMMIDILGNSSQEEFHQQQQHSSPLAFTSAGEEEGYGITNDEMNHDLQHPVSSNEDESSDLFEELKAIIQK